MRRVAVPPAHRAPIRQIARVSAEVFSRLLDALSVDPKGPLVRSGLCEAVSDALDVDVAVASVLVDALLGAHSVQQRRNVTSIEVAEAIVSEAALKLSEGEREVGAERLQALLQLESLGLLARAVQLLAEEGDSFCHARTMSDLRPVFTPDSDPPSVAGTLIRHSLKIRFHTESELEAFSVTLDDRGLLKLRDAIDRAIAKGRSLRELAEVAGMRVIEIEDIH